MKSMKEIVKSGAGGMDWTEKRARKCLAAQESATEYNVQLAWIPRNRYLYVHGRFPNCACSRAAGISLATAGRSNGG